MVVLTIDTFSSKHTVYSKEPISRPSYVRLLTSLLYNSWYNLQTIAEISVTDNETQDQDIIRLIHCDPVDNEQNLLNGKPSSVLAQFNIKGKPHEKVHHQMLSQNVLREAASDDFINSVTLSVKDIKGAPFDFKGAPLE